MKKYGILALLGMMLVAGCVSSKIENKLQPISRAEQIRSELGNAAGKHVFVVAHRAAWKNAPENSRSAVVNAINMGVDIIEIDIRKTRDGEYILMHDTTVDRTTNGKGQVKDLTLEQLRKLRLIGSDGQPGKEVIPTLSEILQLAKGRIMVNLDKAGSYFNEIQFLLKRTGTSRQVILKGRYNSAEVYAQLGVDSDIIYMPIFRMNKKHNALENKNGILDLRQMFSSNEQIKMTELVFANLDSPALSTNIMREFKFANVRLWVNTLKVAHPIGYSDQEALKNPDRVWGTLIRRGFSIIQTDEPKVLLDYLRIKKLHD